MKFGGFESQKNTFEIHSHKIDTMQIRDIYAIIPKKESVCA